MALLPPNPVLEPLHVLIGHWAVEVPQFPGAQGRATVEWLEGGAYLRGPVLEDLAGRPWLLPAVLRHRQRRWLLHPRILGEVSRRDGLGARL
jgi:hypothetical protein